MPISVTGGASTAGSGGGGIEPAIAVASRAGAGEATAGFGCTGTGTTTTVDGAGVAFVLAAAAPDVGGRRLGRGPSPGGERTRPCEKNKRGQEGNLGTAGSCFH